MATLSNTIVINAPAEKIFNYMDDPYNLLEVWPGLTEVKDVGKLPNGGVSYKYTFKVLGVSIEGYSEDIEHVQNARTVSKSSGGIDSVATVTFDPVEQGTRVTVVYDYTVPVPLVGRLAEAMIVKMNEQDAATMLANIKAKMEA